MSGLGGDSRMMIASGKWQTVVMMVIIVLSREKLIKDKEELKLNTAQQLDPAVPEEPKHAVRVQKLQSRFSQ